MKTYRFTARIEPGDGGGAGVIVPFNVEKEFGAKGRFPVKVTFDGAPYVGSLMKCGPGQHMLGILKAIRAQIGKEPGDLVDVEIWKDDPERTVAIPEEFERLLKEEGLLETFAGLSYTHRKEYCQ